MITSRFAKTMYGEMYCPVCKDAHKKIKKIEDLGMNPMGFIVTRWQCGVCKITWRYEQVPERCYQDKEIMMATLGNPYSSFKQGLKNIFGRR